MNLLLKFNLILLVVFGIALVPVAKLSKDLLQSNARDQVTENARLMMDAALAMRGYTNKQIKPLIASQLAEKFLPQSVPAYSATEIFNDLRVKNPQYAYKEATLNPTNPRDRTVDWEADVVNIFRGDAKKTELIGERDTPEGRSLYLAKPIRITDPGCLGCHTTPDVAPASMVAAYGPNNGFGWLLNEVVGAQIVSVPMAVPIEKANSALRKLIQSFAGVFALTLVMLNLMLHFFVIRPIRQLAHVANEVSTGNMDVPEVAAKGNDEVAALTTSFNRMRISLSKALKMLEEG